MKEAEVQALIRMEARQQGRILWRNNRGVAYDSRGIPVRFGLANDSAQMNKKIKSGDLIGITPVVILPEHVGTTVGVFTSYEVKRPGWVYTATPSESAQQAWIEMVRQFGGIATFARGMEDVL
jgi:hypothetical protein